MWSRSDGLIFEGKAAKRKSHESYPRRRAAETLADDASLAVPIGRFAFIAATPFPDSTGLQVGGF